jgi:predicted acetyltransferase
VFDAGAPTPPSQDVQNAGVPELTIREITSGDRPVLERLYQLYRHDLSEFRDSLPEPDGLFRTHLLPAYFDPAQVGAQGLHALLAWRGERPVGFCLVNRLPDGARTVHDFFVVRRVRRDGVGRALALATFSRWPGRWEIGFQEENPTAARFWRRLATDLVGPGWREERRPVPDKPHLPDDVVLLLDSSVAGTA